MNTFQKVGCSKNKVGPLVLHLQLVMVEGFNLAVAIYMEQAGEYSQEKLLDFTYALMGKAARRQINIKIPHTGDKASLDRCG